MKVRVLAVLSVAAALLAIPTVAWAKGPSVATISGPGLQSPITVKGMGEPGAGSQLADLAEQSGLFSAAYGATGNGQVLSGRPEGSLGARYTVTYTIPNGQPKPGRVVMDIYPYAPGGPVSYTHPGAAVFPGQQPPTPQWFQGPADLRLVLISIGLPDRPALIATAAPVATNPAPVATNPVTVAEPVLQARHAGSWATTLWLSLGIGGPLLAGAGAALFFRRRRPRVAASAG